MRLVGQAGSQSTVIVILRPNPPQISSNDAQKTQSGIARVGDYNKSEQMHARQAVGQSHRRTIPLQDRFITEKLVGINCNSAIVYGNVRLQEGKVKGKACGTFLHVKPRHGVRRNAKSHGPCP